MAFSRRTVLLVIMLMTFSALGAIPASAGDDAPGAGPGPLEDRAEPTCNFTWLVAEGVPGIGSTGMYIHEGDLDIFIEAFPASGTDWDPRAVTDADIIIQAPHGHVTHYDANTVAMVAKNTGAYVVGNAQLKSDMLARGVSSSKIVELSPTQGGEASVTDVLGVNITSIGMYHTYATTTQVDTFYVEMPNGIKFFHGTCASAGCYDAYMKNRAYLKGLHMMALDFEHNFGTIDTNLHGTSVVLVTSGTTTPRGTRSSTTTTPTGTSPRSPTSRPSSAWEAPPPWRPPRTTRSPSRSSTATTTTTPPAGSRCTSRTPRA